VSEPVFAAVFFAVMLASVPEEMRYQRDERGGKHD
jgi:hypothetical protein